MALPSGAVAYVVPDRELPLVNIAIYVHVGSYLEPAGKEGLADLTGYLLARGGTQSHSADALEEQLDFLAAQLDSGISANQGSVSLNLLSKDLDQGLGILREVLTAPRFQDDKIALRKEQVLQAMEQRNDESDDIEGREFGFLAFGERFWANHYSTSTSIDSITRDDVVAFHQRWFHPANFVVAVNGDFERDDMVKKLNSLFADWPFAGEQPPPIPTNTDMAPAGIYVVDKDVNQGRVSVVLPGIRRDNPDYLPGPDDEQHSRWWRLYLAHHEPGPFRRGPGLLRRIQISGRHLLSADLHRQFPVQVAHCPLRRADCAGGNGKR